MLYFRMALTNSFMMRHNSERAHPLREYTERDSRIRVKLFWLTSEEVEAWRGM